ncbi:hypothetical protein LOTGIDRAFT_195517 [Lottia gigantea]|uniref:Glutathione transferase n=1 Tax=Lottia gigantea TaxID=225164 RepID=V3ZU32_LOTGI|nr:hypothetical protein LOTGIDRAFT_195517 [Lottia gigantea]ESO86095.1 hypothetical protein LOTGIDRAFT_195517 [Lottia gigantea]
MASNMYLIWGSGSIPCWKAMLVLEEKGFGGYPNKLVSFSNKEHKGEDVMKLNPRGQVPTFKDGDIVVNESTAICQYLERRYADKGTKLIPDQPAEHASVLQRMFEISNIEQNMMKDYAYYMFRTKKEDQKEEVIKEKVTNAQKELAIWEGYLQASKPGNFVAGKTFSMADAFFFPFIAFSVRLGLNLDKYPAIKEYYNRVSKRDSVQKTWPPHWSTEEAKMDFMKDL